MAAARGSRRSTQEMSRPCSNSSRLRRIADPGQITEGPTAVAAPATAETAVAPMGIRVAAQLQLPGTTVPGAEEALGRTPAPAGAVMAGTATTVALTAPLTAALNAALSVGLDRAAAALTRVEAAVITAAAMEARTMEARTREAGTKAAVAITAALTMGARTVEARGMVAYLCHLHPPRGAAPGAGTAAAITAAIPATSDRMPARRRRRRTAAASLTNRPARPRLHTAAAAIRSRPEAPRTTMPLGAMEAAAGPAPAAATPGGDTVDLPPEFVSSVASQVCCARCMVALAKPGTLTRASSFECRGARFLNAAGSRCGGQKWQRQRLYRQG
mmetsp:Transcript_58411/g.162825  ORF Transcript_58411/g.162825 Transcript_58411/m.162825 type:complete len:330 (+) Transcript_58411:693-1682(+)